MKLTKQEVAQLAAERVEIPNQAVREGEVPLVSVRTSTYNHGPYIRECIEGVLMQKTNFPFEYIIGEDCSTDDTREIVLEYAEKYPDIIRVITGERNVGSKANGLSCIRAARGKYIAMCEGDDYWTDPLKLQKQVDVLEANPNIVLCHHWQRLAVRDGEGGWKEVTAPKEEHGYCPETRTSVRDVFDNKVRCKTRTNLHRNVYDKMELPEWIYDCKFGDVPLIFLLGKYGDFHFIDEPMAVYRQTGEGISTQGANLPGFQMRHYQEWVKIWDYGNRFYGAMYYREARKTVGSFYKKILVATRVKDLKVLKELVTQRMNAPQKTWRYDGWLLFRLPGIFIGVRLQQIYKACLRRLPRTVVTTTLG